jgi:hypothetical protein
MIDESGSYQPYQPYQPYPSGPSARTTEPSQSTRGKTQRNSPIALGLARILPPLSALLLLVAVRLPWAGLRIAYGDILFDAQFSGMDGILRLGSLDDRSRLLSALLYLLWDVAPVCGLFLCLALSIRRRISWLLLSVYGVWLLMVTALSLLSLRGAFTASGYIECAANCTGVTRAIEWGAWAACAALVFGWLALALLIRYWALIERGPSATISRYSALHRAGAAVLTLGVALWAVGLYAVPWATSGSDCTGLHFSLNHFVRGTCSGMDGYDMLSATLSGDGQLAWALFEAVTVIGLFIAIAVWLPHLTRATWIIAIGWSLLVTLVVVMGLHGIEVTMAHPPHFTINEGPWGSSLGVALCALGIVICLVGVVLLIRDELRRAG